MCFEFVFPDAQWWWTPYSCGYWPLYIFFWEVSVWVICPFCSLGHLSLCRIFGYVLDRRAFSNICIVSIFSSVCGFPFHTFDSVLEWAADFNLICLIYLSTLTFMVIAIEVLSKKFLSSLKWQRFSPTFSFYFSLFYLGWSPI